MSESGEGTNHGCMQDLILLILIVKVSFQELIGREIRCMGGYAATGYDLGSFPKTEETLFLIENTGGLEKCKLRAAGLEMSL